MDGNADQPQAVQEKEVALSLWFSLLDHDGGLLGEMRADLAPGKVSVFDLCLEIKRMCPETVLCDPYKLKVCDTSTNTVLDARADLTALTEPSIEVLVPKTAINEALADFASQLGDGAPSQVEWVADALRPACSLCKRQFTWFRRRHHCRRCGEVFCNGCSSKRLLVNSTRSRVCDSCFSAVSRPRFGSQSMPHDDSEEDDELPLHGPSSPQGGPVVEVQKQQELVREAEGAEDHKGEVEDVHVALLTPQVSREDIAKGLAGTWSLENRDGDLEDFMDKLGVPWLTRKLANSVSSFTMIASFEGTDAFVVQMRSAVRNIDKPRIVLDGHSIAHDVNVGTGDKMEVVGSWQADGSIVLEKRNLKDASKNIREVRRFVDGKHVVEMTLVHKGVTYVDTYVRS